MKKKYYNIEERISTYSEIINVKGKNGLRVYVEDEDNFYFWVNDDWALEVPVKTVPEPPKAAFTYIKGLITQSGTSSPTVSIMGNTVYDDSNHGQALTFSRDSAGYYKADLSIWAQGISKTFYGIVQNTTHSNQVFSMKYRVDNVLEIYTGTADGTLQDNLLDNTPFYIEIYA